MKRTVRFLGLFAALLLLQLNAIQTYASRVDLKTAKHIAALYMSAKTGEKSLNDANMTLVYEIPNVDLGITALYFFNTSNGGFCVVSGDDCMDPIIAYSTESVLDANSMAPAFLWYLNNFAENIRFYQNTKATPAPEVMAMWKEIAAGNVQADNSKQIWKTMTSIWNQDYPFNIYSPTVAGQDYWGDPDTIQAPTGCVATAMSQIIHYWKYPVKPTGTVQYYWRTGDLYLREKLDTVTYNYDLMPDTAFRRNMYGNYCWWNDAQIRETSKLNYHCGLANHMDYDYDGSGALSETYTRLAFINNFKYDRDSIQAIDRTKYPFVNSSSTPKHGDTLWLDTLAREIKAKRPIFYTGYDLSSSGVHAGHAFNMERYNSSTKMGWFNWGWGGSGDCWCNVIKSQLTASEYTFQSKHWALIGIQPPADTINPGGNEPALINPVESQIQVLPAYPNPAREWVNIPYSLGNETQAVLEIYSIDGRLMERRTVHAGNNQACINVSAYAKGIYVCRIGGVARKFSVE